MNKLKQLIFSSLLTLEFIQFINLFYMRYERSAPPASE